MSEVSIPIPVIGLDQSVDIEVKMRVNGIEKVYDYRIEPFEWKGQNTEDKVDRLKSIINGQKEDWQFYQICNSSEELIVLMFRKVKSIR